MEKPTLPATIVHSKLIEVKHRSNRNHTIKCQQLPKSNPKHRSNMLAESLTCTEEESSNIASPVTKDKYQLYKRLHIMKTVLVSLWQIAM